MSEAVEAEVPLEGESSGGGNDSSWLHSIIVAEREIKVAGVVTPQIKKVSGIFTAPDHINCMIPLVVSLGPCHHGGVNLDEMEKEKKIAGRLFVKNVKQNIRRWRNDDDQKVIEKCYKEVEEAIKEARESYAEEVMNSVSEQDFKHMMFLDGCFMAYFIEGTNEGTIESELISREFPNIVRDMFLFENQIPFVVLYAIMKLRFRTRREARNQIFKFITRQNTLTNFHYSNELTWRFFGWRIRQYQLLFGSGQEETRHLFDIIRRMLLGSRDERGKKTTEVAAVERYTPRQLGSVAELKGDGIGFGRSNSGQLTSAKFVNNFFLPRILLPEIAIDRATKSLVINLIAFESCFSSGSDDMVVTSFIKFMKSLVRTAEDVKELRAKSILYHGLCSDEDVAKLFHELPISSTSDLPAYITIERRVMSYRDSKLRVAVARWSSTYFGSRWIAVTSLAAALMIFLTAVQTIFSVFPRG